MPVMMLQLVWSVERSDRKTFSILPGFHGQVWLGNHGQICSLIQSMDFQSFPIAEWIFFRIEKEHMESPGWQLIIWYFLILQSFPGLNQSAKFHAGFFSVLRTSLMLAVRFSTLVAWAPMCCCSNHHSGCLSSHVLLLKSPFLLVYFGVKQPCVLIQPRFLMNSYGFTGLPDKPPGVAKPTTICGWFNPFRSPKSTSDWLDIPLTW